MNNTHPVMLIILDGFGISTNTKYNAITHANMPNWTSYTQKYAFNTLVASGNSVGLPVNQCGNSEVGHLNIGTGRIITQSLSRINQAIEDGSFNHNIALTTAITNASIIHIMGLLSDGGVHAHIAHIFALIKLASTNSNITKIYLHIFLDGRDSPPMFALNYCQQLLDFIQPFNRVQIATISGRYYAMDRDGRYDRLQLTYEAIVNGNSTLHASNICDILTTEYANGTSDEFIKPYVIANYHGIQDGDSVIFANFRADRAFMLTDSLIGNNFQHFIRRDLHLMHFVSMTNYSNIFNKALVAFDTDYIKNTFGEYVSSYGIRQLRIAETEKYPHVTYFFDGGQEQILPNMDKILIPSVRTIATYDLKPEMSLDIVTTKIIDAIQSKQYDCIITNFANGDMVGHTGNFAATIMAVEALDRALGAVVTSMLKHSGEILIVADHGNCEEMFDDINQQPHTQHTANIVPCLYIGRTANIMNNGSLQDVAPTLLAIMGLDKPQEMTGHNLIQWINT